LKALVGHLLRADQFSALCVTSPRSLQAISAALHSVHATSNLTAVSAAMSLWHRERPLFAVGPASASAARAIGFVDVRTPETDGTTALSADATSAAAAAAGAPAADAKSAIPTGAIRGKSGGADCTAASLARVIGRTLVGSNSGTSAVVLVLVGARRRDDIFEGLREHKCPFVECAVYGTALTDTLRLPTPEPMLVAFFSPSGLEAVRLSIERRSRQLQTGTAAANSAATSAGAVDAGAGAGDWSAPLRLAIGPTTGKALADRGREWAPHAVAAKPNPVALLTAAWDALKQAGK
jgi:uroporphyrinogen-III synthase